MELFEFMPENGQSIKKSDDFRLYESLPLPTADSLLVDEAFGDIIRWKNSRVVRFYRLTPPVFPKEEEWSFGEEGKKVPFVPCPLFPVKRSDLSPDQKKYFQYFYSCLEKGEKVAATFSYLTLAVCYLLRQGCEKGSLSPIFYWIWENYRRDFPVMDKIFADALLDFCFFTGTKPDYEKIGKIFTSGYFQPRPLLMDLYLFDFLFRPERKLSPKEMNFILRNLTSESFRKSKAYRVNTRFSSACEEAVFRAFEKGLFCKDKLNENIFSQKLPSAVHTVRPLFGSLPEGEVPACTINLCYAPLLHDSSTRWRCDEIIRYLENRMRGIFKIKNALSRVHISESHKEFLEAILSPYEVATRKTEEAEVPLFLETPKKTREISLDPKKASEIESASWEVTEKLTENYLKESEEVLTLGANTEVDIEESYKAELRMIDRPGELLSAGDFWEFAANLTETEDLFLSTLLYFGKDKAREYALSQGAFPEAMISALNRKAYDAVGDGVIDGAGEVYTEYKMDLKEVFLEPKGDNK